MTVVIAPAGKINEPQICHNTSDVTRIDTT
jgi:hypothetical protein